MAMVDMDQLEYVELHLALKFQSNNYVKLSLNIFLCNPDINTHV